MLARRRLRSIALGAIVLTAILLLSQSGGEGRRLAVTDAAAQTSRAKAPSSKKAIWGPVRVGGVSQFPIYRELGAGIFQTVVYWNEVAPTEPADADDPRDPAYRWPAEIDDAIAEARKQRITLHVLLTRAPAWANGGRSEPSFAPRDPRDFAAFARAASRRWPYVSRWQVWGEPSREANFKPLVSERRGRPLNAAQRRAPQLYARILDATYAKLKATDRKDLVIGGNTFTTGEISPRNYVRYMKLPNGRSPRMDLYGHNPFTGRRPNLSKPPLGNGFADFSDLDTLTAWLDRYQRRPGRKPLRIFISEFTLPTDQSGFEFNFFVSRATQSGWLRDALRITRRERRIATLGWLQLYDDPPRAGKDERRYGLIDAQGKRKPSFRTFARG